jgi:hypothetical protein
MQANITTHDGKQLAADRALADLGIRELAVAAAITPRALHRLETGRLIHVSDKNATATCGVPYGNGSLPLLQQPACAGNSPLLEDSACARGSARTDPHLFGVE